MDHVNPIDGPCTLYLFMKDRFRTLAKMGTLCVLIILTKYIYAIRKLLIPILDWLVLCRLIKPCGLSKICVAYILHLDCTLIFFGASSRF